MKSFDFFRKVNIDIETSTKSGGVFSIVAALCGLFLFITEFSQYSKLEINHELFVNNDFDGDFTINLNITFTSAPCELISIDLEDELGHLDTSKHDYLEFIKLNKYGNEIQTINKQEEGYINSEAEIDDLIEKINNGEQCQVIGFIEAKKTPGNMQFGFRERSDAAQKIMRKNIAAYKKLDIDYIINNLYFGDLVQRKNKYKKNIFGLFGRSYTLFELYGLQEQAFDPYQGMKFEHKGKQDFENHLSLLPVNIMSLSKSKGSQELYQYNIYSGAVGRRETDLPTAYFRYKMNPVNISYFKKQKPFYHFIVNMLAIVGGIFSLVGMTYQGIQKIMDYINEMKNK
ncbi:hypothetical protein PPERSA_06747 [Pseudocohnilembus persalinus]|uniref:Endoplasmic reticulum vesicle transporter, C-terminal n=1 Tax=Pseudocohnilembus persalinus TaxID=266149 RepID=A0A0V0QS51_PSEPJ|nr:hypothetical protein PPERSA_06747 [Pseudocohnilembus persalinus]|eukprot:KRX05113.1 hypothetical protein PPERSA_06747 [Pseudocohnilembus persalinus]